MVWKLSQSLAAAFFSKLYPWGREEKKSLSAGAERKETAWSLWLYIMRERIEMSPQQGCTQQKQQLYWLVIFYIDQPTGKPLTATQSQTASIILPFQLLHFTFFIAHDGFSVSWLEMFGLITALFFCSLGVIAGRPNAWKLEATVSSAASDCRLVCLRNLFRGE